MLSYYRKLYFYYAFCVCNVLYFVIDKPQDDKENVSPTLTTLSSDSSDKIPLLKKFSTSDGRSGSSSGILIMHV